jgi:predicted DNA-binding protein
MTIPSKFHSVFCGVRLSAEQIQFIDSRSKRTPRTTRSDIIRDLITQEIMGKETADNENRVFEELQAIQERIHLNEQYLVYLSSLLTALVRRTSKSDPSEAERMIDKAKEEAGREEKVKPILSKARN